MYTHSEESYEDLWYEPGHMDRVLAEIKGNFSHYFDACLASDQGNAPDSEAIKKLAEKFGSKSTGKKKVIDRKVSFQGIILESQNEFNKDRKKYLNVLDEKKFDEYGEDPAYFKSTILRNKCPIIHSTLHNTAAKELDKFRAAFNLADPQDLLDVVKNIAEFSREYVADPPENHVYEKIGGFEELGFEDLDSDKYSVQGVVGGGIRTQFLYRLAPDRFPYRSREAVWALWYLTAKKPLGSKKDSEFLMIDLEKSITQQNYFYPYELFGFYAFNIMYLLKKEAAGLGVRYPEDHRFVPVDSFLSYIARHHEKEINQLKQKVDDEHIY